MVGRQPERGDRVLAALLFCFFFGILAALVHESGGSRSRQQGSGDCIMEITFWEVTSLNQPDIIPEYRKYIGLGSLGPNPNLG